MNDFIQEPFGKWDPKNRLMDYRTTRVISQRRTNLLGKLFTASMYLTNNDSINHMNDYQ